MKNLIENLLVIISTVILGIGSFLFMKYNAPIIKLDYLMYLTLTLNLLAIAGTVFMKQKKKGSNIFNLLLSFVVSAFIVVVMLQSVLFDYFQPLALYDQVIYIAIVGLVLFIVYFIITNLVLAIKKIVRLRDLTVMLLIVLFIFQFITFGKFQSEFEFSNTSDVIHVFETGEGGYKTFRIPTVLVIPKDSKLATGEIIDEDYVLVMAEARRDGSLDDGDIDLVQKISRDGGKTWSALEVIKEFEGIGKIGNSTPVFDAYSGQINLLFIKGEKKADYKTYQMISQDGGSSWSKDTFVFDGLVGPGHGVMLQGGAFDGRLLIPGYKGGSLSLYSDDHGVTWQVSEPLSDGNEAEIVQVNDNEVMMIVRTNIGVAKPHDELHKLYVTSNDGVNWSEFKTLNVKEPICMSSVVELNGKLYYSHPDDFYSRGNMTIKSASDDYKFDEGIKIYQGPSGYSDLGVLSNNQLVLIFENGRVEYDQRITVVLVPVK